MRALGFCLHVLSAKHCTVKLRAALPSWGSWGGTEVNRGSPPGPAVLAAALGQSAASRVGMLMGSPGLLVPTLGH